MFYQDRDEQGIQDLIKMGLQEERYIPALELDRSYLEGSMRWGRSNLTLTFSPLSVFTVEARGAMEYGWNRRSHTNTPDSYEMVKNFNDGTLLDWMGNPEKHLFPRGGRLRETTLETFSYTARLQANYDQTFGIHRVTALAGAELRERIDKAVSNELLGYNPQSLAYSPVDEVELSQGGYGTAALWSYFDYTLEKGVSEDRERFASLYAVASYSPYCNATI